MSNSDMDIVQLEIAFPVKISVAVFSIAAILDVLFYMTTGSLENTLIFSSATIAAAGTVLAAFYSARILSLQLEQDVRGRAEYLKSLNLKKKENAMQFGARWTDPHMQQSRKICRKITNMKGHSLEQVRSVLNDESKELDVFHLLNFFEEMATAIEHDIADSATLKELYSEAVHSVWQSLHLWIEDYKKTHQLNDAWLLFEKLQGSWSR